MSLVEKLIILTVVLILLGAGVGKIVETRTKMNTFNRMSKDKITFWEAMVNDVRLQPTK